MRTAPWSFIEIVIMFVNVSCCYFEAEPKLKSKAAKLSTLNLKL